MRTQFRIDTFQPTYFVVDDFESLFEATRPDLTPTYAELRATEDIAAGAIVPGDVVHHAGRSGSAS
jgi:phenylalanine-4-hydroxylase